MNAARVPLSIACVLAACALSFGTAHAAPQGRVAFAEYEIAGPCTDFVLDAGVAGQTHVAGNLRVGESRRVTLPVPTTAGAPPLEPRVESGNESAGAAFRPAVRFLQWVERDPRLARRSPALRARPAPAVGARRVRAPVAVLALLAAAFLVGLALLRRTGLAAILALVAGGAAFALARRGLERDAPPVEVIDGLAGEGQWQRARAARDALTFPSEGPTFELATEPAHAPLRIEAEIEPGRPARVLVRGATLVATWSEPWPADALDPRANQLAPLAETWIRADGVWTDHGAWPAGAALGPAVPGSDPPGWLVAGLPQGLGLVVGRLATGAESEGAERTGESNGTTTFVRSTWP